MNTELTCPEDTYVPCNIPSTPVSEIITVRTELPPTGGDIPAAEIGGGLSLLLAGVVILTLVRRRRGQRKMTGERVVNEDGTSAE